MHEALLAAADLAALRSALSDFTVDGVGEMLDTSGTRALERGDRAGVAHALRTQLDDPLSTLIRLFLLADPVQESAARRALHPLPLERAAAAGLLTVSAGSARAALDLRPYGQSGSAPGDPVPVDSAPGERWWVVSDLGADGRGGPLAGDHVLGIGSASLTLAQATPREPVGSALDLGTGCGIQSLHLSMHSSRVVATDVSERALRMAATTAALSGQAWELRAGSACDPVGPDERFDLVVANPPFVVSDGSGGGGGAGGGRGGYAYRDTGRAGDVFCADLIRAVPRVLAPGGTARLLANWIVPADGDWSGRVGEWLRGSGCDAWVWQREVVDPAEYVALWLGDAGLRPEHPEWRSRYTAWLDWFMAAGVAAVGMGLISMWRTGSSDPSVVLEDVPQAIEAPAGPQLTSWLTRARWQAATSDTALLATQLHLDPGARLELTDVVPHDADAGGWRTVSRRLHQAGGMRWEIEVDEAVATLLAGCDGSRPLAAPVAVLAATLGESFEDVGAAVLPAIRDLIGRGILLPPGR